VKEIVSFVVACLLAAGASFAASSHPQEKQAAVASAVDLRA
jgi:hypothetical protein